ncbi:MAG TPA: hypothetical protein DD675_25930 [Raoultella ornithinolytica]|nr:hypothetical protein [Raoultella ornithinolytica]
MMPSKLKLRRWRRIREDLAWYKAEADDWKAIALEHANELSVLRRHSLHVPLPVLIPVEIVHQLNAGKHKDHPLCKTCNDGLRGGCSSCAYNIR